MEEMLEDRVEVALKVAEERTQRELGESSGPLEDLGSVVRAEKAFGVLPLPVSLSVMLSRQKPDHAGERYLGLYVPDTEHTSIRQGRPWVTWLSGFQLWLSSGGRVNCRYLSVLASVASGWVNVADVERLTETWGEVDIGGLTLTL